MGEDDEEADMLENKDQLLGLAELLGANERGELHELGPGMIIDGKWELRARLGKGSFGEVYEAWHIKLDHPAAIKFLVGNRQDAKQRFLEEAQLMAEMSSEHLVRASDYGELPDGSPYFVMDLVKGKSLRHWLSMERLPMWRAVETGAEIVEGLAEAHKRGVVHGDIKPENVVIGDDDGKARLLDFGLAQTSAANAEVCGGTPHYMAPEMLFDDATASECTDVYAVGVVLYEMLTGRLPRGHLNMEGFSEVKLAWARKPTPKPVRMYCRDVPEAQREALKELDKFVMAALARNPAARPKSAVPMLEDLRRLTKRLAPEAMAPTLTAESGGATTRTDVKISVPFVSAIATASITIATILTTLMLEWRLEPALIKMPFHEEVEITAMQMLTVPYVNDRRRAGETILPEGMLGSTVTSDQPSPPPSHASVSKRNNGLKNELGDVRKMMERGDWNGAEDRIRALKLRRTNAELNLLLAEVYVELDGVKNRKLIEGELDQAERLRLSEGQTRRLVQLRQRIE